jgi:hypothetical protein
MGSLTFIAKCFGNAGEVLSIAKQTLEAAIQLSNSGVFDEYAWTAALPEAFIKASPPFPTPEELEAYNRLSLDERIERDSTAGWPLRAFINSFRPEPEMRYWSWWDAAILDENHIAVAVEIKEWPFPWQALRWLLKASGAIDLEPEPANA